MSDLIVSDGSSSSSDEQINEMAIESGQYYRLKKDSIYPEGTLLLISSLNILDNILHSIELNPHPTIEPEEKNHRIIYEKFITDYEFVPFNIALSERESSIQEQNELIEKTREEMMIGYINEEGISAVQLINNVNNQDKAQAQSLPLKIGGDVDQYEKQAKDIQNIAEEQRKFITSKNTIISSSTQKLASYYQEKGVQALACVEGTLKYVAQLQKGIHTLSLFTGKGVHITKIAEGEGANHDEPLTFYQRKLFLDEEFFFEIHNGGADYESINNFSEALEKNFSVIDRIIPSQRGVVMMQFRRNDKQYFSDEQIEESPFWTAIQNSEQNENNKARFILIRNGFNVYKLDCLDFFEASRLFPTEKEISGFYNKNTNRFSGVDIKDGKVSPKDLEYVEARDKHDSKGVFYKRLLIILSGIYTREPEIFGSFKGAKEYSGAWYNIDFQKKHCKFIHDDEEGLDFNLIHIDAFLKQKNKMMMGGSRVIVNNKDTMNRESAPKAVRYLEESHGHGYKRRGGEYWYFEPNKRSELHTVDCKKNNFYISVNCRPTYMSSTDEHSNVNVNLNQAPSNSFIVLDGITKLEIELYLNSRKAREHYLSYAEFLIEARKLIELDEIENADFLSSFQNHIYEQYSDIENKKIDEAIDEAIRLYRAGNAGKPLPKVKDSNYNEVVRNVSLIFHTTLNKEQIVKSIIESFDLENDEVLLKVAINKKGDYLLYSKPKDIEYILEDDFRVIESNIYKVKKTKKTISFKYIKSEHYSVRYDEVVIYQNENYLYADEFPKPDERIRSISSNGTKFVEISGEEVNLRNNIITKNGYEIYQNIKQALLDGKDLLSYAVGDGIPLALSKKLLKTYFTKQKNTTKYYIEQNAYIPLSIIGIKGVLEIYSFRRDDEKQYCRSRAIGIVYAQIADIGEFIAQFGDNESFEYLCKYLNLYGFAGVVKRFKELRDETWEYRIQEMHKQTIFYTLVYLNDFKLEKINNIHGIYREDFYTGDFMNSPSYAFNRFGNNDQHEHRKTIDTLINGAIEKHFEINEHQKDDHKWIVKDNEIMYNNDIYDCSNK